MFRKKENKVEIITTSIKEYDLEEESFVVTDELGRDFSIRLKSSYYLYREMDDNDVFKIHSPEFNTIGYNREVQFDCGTIVQSSRFVSYKGLGKVKTGTLRIEETVIQDGKDVRIKLEELKDETQD